MALSLVLCHSRSPFMSTVTLVRSGAVVAGGLGVEPSGGSGAANVSSVVPDSMINSPIESATSHARAAFKSEPSRTPRPE